jgi:hypothetical protein
MFPARPAQTTNVAYPDKSPSAFFGGFYLDQQDRKHDQSANLIVTTTKAALATVAG